MPLHRLRALAIRVLNLVRRTQLDRDLREQIDAHIQQLEDDLAQRGMERDAARATARRAIGNSLLVRERARDQQAFPALDTLMSDIRLAARRLRRQCWTTVVSTLALACGIGATAAAWSLFSQVVLRPLPVHDPDRLVIVGSRFHQHGYPLYAALRESGVFEGVAAVGSRTLPVGRDRTVPGLAYFASHEFFDVLGIRPTLGRDFEPEDDRRGAPLVAMLSDRYWRRELGARPDVVGAQVVVSGRSAVVIGIVPRDFRGLDLTEPADIYLPLHAAAHPEWPATIPNLLDQDATRAAAWLTIVGRLGASVDAAQVTARLRTLLPDVVRSNGTRAVTSLSDAAIPRSAVWSTQSFGLLVGVTMALLLAIGCLAAGVLLLLRTEARRDEFAVCLALGASRRRLIRGVVMEGALLALAGLLLAVPASAWLLAGTRAFELPDGVQVDLSLVSVDPSALLVAGATALVATLTVSIAAGGFVFAVGVTGGRRPHPGATPRLARARTRTFLAAGQVALSVVLLAGATLFARSLAGALAVGPGDSIRRLVTGTIDPRDYGHTNEQAAQFFGALEQRLRSHPAIVAVSIAKPYTNSLGGVTLVDGVPHQFASFIYYQGVDEQYFATLGLPAIAGRGFSASDGEDSRSVAIVSESFARLLARGGDPVGRRLGPIWWRPKDTSATIVGVVPDVVTNLTLRSPYVIYMPVAQMPGRARRTFFVRTPADPDATIDIVTGAIRAIDPAIVPPSMQTIGERVDEQLRAQRIGMLAMGGVGVASVLLTALGAYVLAASLVMRRRRELGIRAALGASRSHLGLIVLREAGVVAVGGVLAGVAIVRAGLEPIRAFLFQIEPFDPPSVVSAATVLLLLVAAVSLKPALAAMRVDVARTLAEE